jgi:hypothetical protein
MFRLIAYCCIDLVIGKNFTLSKLDLMMQLKLEKNSVFNVKTVSISRPNNFSNAGLKPS